MCVTSALAVTVFLMCVASLRWQSLSLLRVCPVYSHGLYNVCVQSTLGYGYGLWSLTPHLTIFQLYRCGQSTLAVMVFILCVQSALAVMVFILCVSSHIGSQVFILCVQSHWQSWCLYCVSSHIGSHGVYTVCVQSHWQSWFLYCVCQVYFGRRSLYTVCVKSTLAVVVFINGVQSLSCCW